MCCGFMGLWMLIYSKFGKLRHRNRILNLIDWKGSENVLDIGTGRGLLMIGAAKRLTTGKSTGINIWNAEDLTANKMENTLKNAVIEGVKDKVDVKNDNAVNMSFQDNTYEIIISNLCLHNINNFDERKKACNEIVRVLKNGGTSVISDFKHINEYKNNFKELGVNIVLFRGNYFTSFPHLSNLVIKMFK